MKKIVHIIGGICLLLAIVISSESVFAQDAATEEESYEVESVLKYWKEKYELKITGKSFEQVCEVIKKSVHAPLCQTCDSCPIVQFTTRQDNEGFAKAVIVTDFCVIVAGDTAYENVKPYSVLQSTETEGHNQLPYIPGGRWTNARIVFKFVVKENSDETVDVVLKNCELSGMEAYVTRKFHFWESNGLLETAIMKKIEDALK